MSESRVSVLCNLQGENIRESSYLLSPVIEKGKEEETVITSPLIHRYMGPILSPGMSHLIRYV